jgi:hypothetical protein
MPEGGSSSPLVPLPCLCLPSPLESEGPTATCDAIDEADDHFLSRDLDVSLAGRELSLLLTPQGDLFTL